MSYEVCFWPLFLQKELVEAEMKRTDCYKLAWILYSDSFLKVMGFSTLLCCVPSSPPVSMVH